MAERTRWDPIPWLFGVFLVAGLAVVFLVDPASSDLYPKCPTWALFHLYCAGCGTLRAVHDLLHGDLAGALAMNSVMVLALPFLLHGLWATMAQHRTGRALPHWMTSGRAGQALIWVLVAYTVMRNLPWYPFTLLAPH